MQDGLSTGAITAIASGLTALVTALFIRGGPAIVAWWNRSDALEQLRNSQAKEGPLMVIARLESELIETKVQVKELVAELRAIQKEHANCQTEQASMRVRIEYQTLEIAEQKQHVADLKNQMAEVQKQQGIWQKIEAKARIEGDAANAEQPK